MQIALRRFGQLGSVEQLGMTHAMASVVLDQMADFEGARREATAAAAIFEGAGILALLGVTLLFLATIERTQGHPAESLAALRRAAEAFFQASDVRCLERCVHYAAILPAELTPERDAFLAATQARIAALRAAAAEAPIPPVPPEPADPGPAEPAR